MAPPILKALPPTPDSQTPSLPPKRLANFYPTNQISWTHCFNTGPPPAPTAHAYPLLHDAAQANSHLPSDPTHLDVDYTRPDGSALLSARPPCSSPSHSWSCDSPTTRNCTPYAFLFWSHLAAYNDTSLHGTFIPKTGDLVPPQSYIHPACLSKAFREVLADATPSSFHAFLHKQLATFRYSAGASGPPLPPGFRAEFLDDPKILTPFLRGKTWSTSVPSSPTDLARTFHPFHFLLTLPNCTSPRLPYLGLTISLLADLL